MSVEQKVSQQEKKPSTPVNNVLQRSAINESRVSEVPPLVHEVLRSPGQPLDKETRDFFEPRFGHNFTQVRVHTDAKAAESAQAVNALAYTVGRDLIFDTGQYAPQTYLGKRLIAHELTHIMQQGTQLVPSQPLTIGSEDNLFEHQAQQTSESLLPGEESLARLGNGVDVCQYNFPLQSLQRQSSNSPVNSVTPAIDDKKVQKYIDDALEEAKGDVNRASNDLTARRNQTTKSDTCLDNNLAAAEHYMWARYCVASGDKSYISMVILVYAYAVAKSIGLTPKTGDCPASPPSEEQKNWGLKGAKDGQDDFEKSRIGRKKTGAEKSQ